MPHSMTGFASAEVRRGALRLLWEIRSVNHRFLDLSFRMPEDLRALEPECRDLVGDVVKRGKLDCTLKLTTAERAVAPASIYPEAGRCACGDLFYSHSPKELRTLLREAS